MHALEVFAVAQGDIPANCAWAGGGVKSRPRRPDNEEFADRRLRFYTAVQPTVRLGAIRHAGHDRGHMPESWKQLYHYLSPAVAAEIGLHLRDLQEFLIGRTLPPETLVRLAQKQRLSW